MANILWETHTHRGDSVRGGQSGQDHMWVTDRAKDTSFLVPITCRGGDSERQEGVCTLYGFAGTTECKRFNKFRSKDKLFRDTQVSLSCQIHNSS